MSIPATDPATATTQATTPVPPTGSDVPAPLLIGMFVWAVLGLTVARFVGVFRRVTILGPQRLGADESAWTLLVILCGALFCGAELARPVGYFLRKRIDAESLGLLTQGSALLGGVVVAVVVTAVARHDGLRRLGFQGKSILKGLVMGTTAMLLVFPVVFLSSILVQAVYALLHKQQAGPHKLLEEMAAAKNHWQITLQVLTAVVVAPLFEELAFRGFIQTMLGRLCSYAFSPPANFSTPVQIPPTPDDPTAAGYVPKYTIGSRARWAAVVLTSILFALAHVEPAFFLPLFILAMTLGYLYERTGNIWANITLHALFNGTQIVWFLSTRSGR